MFETVSHKLTVAVQDAGGLSRVGRQLALYTTRCIEPAGYDLARTVESRNTSSFTLKPSLEKPGSFHTGMHKFWSFFSCDR